MAKKITTTLRIRVFASVIDLMRPFTDFIVRKSRPLCNITVAMILATGNIFWGALAFGIPQVIRDGLAAADAVAFAPTGFLETHHTPPGLKFIVAPNESIYVYGLGFIHSSPDAGYFWQSLRIPLTGGDSRAIAISPNFPEDPTIFVGTNAGNNALLISPDAGKTWGFPVDLVIGPVNTIALSPDYSNGRTMYIGTRTYGRDHLYRSTDGGQHWEGISLPTTEGIKKVVFSPNYVVDRTVFFLTEPGDFYSLIENGTSLSPLPNIDQVSAADTGITDFAISSNYSRDHKMFLSTVNGLYYSNNSGQDWSRISTGVFSRLEISPNYASDRMLLAIADTILKRSTNSGVDWNTVLSDTTVYDMAFSPQFISNRTVYALTDAGFQRSTHSGTDWRYQSRSIDVLEYERDHILENIVLSPNFENDGVLFAGPDQNGSGRLYKSSDAGITLTDTQVPELGKLVFALSGNYASDQTVLAAIGNHLYRSTNGGGSWTRLTPDLPCQAEILRASPNYASDKTIFMSCYLGLLRSTNGGAAWQNVTGTLPTILQDIEISPGFALDRTVYAVSSSVYHSEDAGNTWQYCGATGFTSGTLISLSPTFVTDNSMFAVLSGTSGGGVYRSTDRCDTWDEISQGKFGDYTRTIAVSTRFEADQTVIAATTRGPLYISEDAGEHWFALAGIPSSPGAYMRSYGAAIGYRNGLLMPIASVADGLYRYHWPEFAPLQPKQIVDQAVEDCSKSLTRTVELRAGELSSPGYVTSEDVPWLSVEPISGTLPTNVNFIYNLCGYSGQLETNVSVDVYWSTHLVDHYSIPLSLTSLPPRVWLPEFYR